jgi:transcriptional regulator with XRE-family HTH domain
MLANKQKELGEKIRQARVIANISQEDLAKIVGIGRNSMIETEKGRREVSISELKIIAEATGKPLSFFLEDEPEIKVATNHSKDIIDLRDLTESQKEFIHKLKEEFKKENA